VKYDDQSLCNLRQAIPVLTTGGPARTVSIETVEGDAHGYQVVYVYDEKDRQLFTASAGNGPV
jgi:hypothetical protein